MEEVGCTSPFLLNKSEICTDFDSGLKAMEKYNQLWKMKNNLKKSCYNPCTIVNTRHSSHFITSLSEKKLNSSAM